MNIYGHKTGELTIGPYQWDPWPQVEQWLNVPNAFIRRVSFQFIPNIYFSVLLNAELTS